MINIACCQYKIELLKNWDSYALKIENLVIEAKDKNADILLMPEYAGVEAVCKKFPTDQELYVELQSVIPKYLNLYQYLSKKYQIYIQAGTIIEEIAENKYANRAYFFSPNGEYQYQDKLQLTQYEKNLQVLRSGNEQKIFDTKLGKIGIAICYDSEFPEIVRNLTYAGAEIILVPSYTTTLAGFHRVFLSCRVRAIENQCYVATSFVVNQVNLSGEIDETFGQAVIVGPADMGFPDDGIIAQGVMSKPIIIVAELSLAALSRVRQEGQVHNFEDSASHANIRKNAVTVIKLQ
jgi:predicted amidohydrolase